jgi:hypothetical protein
VVDIKDVTLVNYEIFMQQHTHDAKVASVQYRRVNGIPSPSNNDTYSA